MTRLTATFLHLYECQTQIPPFPPPRNTEYSYTHRKCQLSCLPCSESSYSHPLCSDIPFNTVLYVLYHAYRRHTHAFSHVNFQLAITSLQDDTTISMKNKTQSPTGTAHNNGKTLITSRSHYKHIHTIKDTNLCIFSINYEHYL